MDHRMLASRGPKSHRTTCSLSRRMPAKGLQYHNLLVSVRDRALLTRKRTTRILSHNPLYVQMIHRKQLVFTQRPPLSSSHLHKLELILTKSRVLMQTNSLPHVLVLNLMEWSHLEALTPLVVRLIKLRLPRCHAQLRNKPVPTLKPAWRTQSLLPMLPPIP